jgi:hypothetical protein
MTHDENGRPASMPAEPIDESTVAALVRDVADGWRMPPRRLDEPTWRDRVGAQGSRQPADRRRAWPGRLAGAATMAVVATVGLSLVAVWLTLPRGDGGLAGASPTSSAGAATPRITDRPIPSPLPKLILSGGLPTVTGVLLRVRGDFAVADLATGTLGPAITATVGNSDLRRLPDGTFVCLCVSADGWAAGSYTHAVVSLIRYTAAGSVADRKAIAEFTGIPDSRPTNPQDQSLHVDTLVSYTSDGRFGFVGWSAREPPVWHAGIVVVEMASGNVLQRVALPDLSTGEDASPVSAAAPRLAVAPSGRRALISRPWFRIDGTTQAYHAGTDQFLADRPGALLAELAPFDGAQGCGDGVTDAGFTAVETVWLSCWNDGGGLTTVRRVGLDGTVLGDTEVNSTGEGGTSTVAPDGSAAWFWAPMTRTITRVDLRTGEDASGTAPEPTASTGDGPLAALGRWLAPPATAKAFLQPGIVLSPDGSRVYALGIQRTADGGSFGGSSGVFVFDAASLAPLGNWAPTADFMSLAVSRDGRFVYAAGTPGVDRSGDPSAFGASVTVFDASDGSVRLLAGQLGHEMVTFATPILP